MKESAAETRIINALPFATDGPYSRNEVLAAIRMERAECIEDAKAEARDCGCADRIIDRIKERGKP